MKERLKMWLTLLALGSAALITFYGIIVSVFNIHK